MVSDRLNFRDAVASTIHESFKSRDDVRVVHENGALVGMNQTTVPVLFYEIIYRTSGQADFSANPRRKDEGAILLTVMVKELSGVRKAISLRDEAAAVLERQNLAGGSTHMAKLLPNSNLVKGWVGYRAEVPFWHYHF